MQCHSACIHLSKRSIHVSYEKDMEAVRARVGEKANASLAGAQKKSFFFSIKPEEIELLWGVVMAP